MTDNPFLCSLPNKQHEATAKDVIDWKRRDEQRRENITTGKRLMAAADRRPTAAPPCKASTTGAAGPTRRTSDLSKRGAADGLMD